MPESEPVKLVKKITVPQHPIGQAVLYVCDDCGALVAGFPHDTREKHEKWHRLMSGALATLIECAQIEPEQRERFRAALRQIAP